MFILSFCSGGVDLIFKGKQLNIIPTDLVIEIIDRFTGDSVMNYTTVCVYFSNSSTYCYVIFLTNM